VAAFLARGSGERVEAGAVSVAVAWRQPLFGGGEAANHASYSAFDRFSLPLFGVPKLALFCVYPMDYGIDDWAGAKSPREANDGDARGRRHLLGGIVMVLTVLPRLEHRGKP
jgi:hypothetical protein